MERRISMNDKVRRQIVYEAARLIYARQESEYYRAKLKAARIVLRGWAPPSLLPTNQEIRDEIQLWSRMHEGDRQGDRLRDLRLLALRVMRALRTFRPRLTGEALSGQPSTSGQIEIHVVSDGAEAVHDALAEAGWEASIAQADSEFVRLELTGSAEIAITTHIGRGAAREFKALVGRRSVEWATIGELEQLLGQEYPDLAAGDELPGDQLAADRFQVYESLLWPLEHVKQNPKLHPEGDALYHSLQVFDLARDELPYDEEFLLAALLHDVGKAIDPRDSIAMGLEALDGFISERTAWLIEHQKDAEELRAGTLGVRYRRRLEAHESFEELQLLGKCDRAGRQRGATPPSVGEALDYVRDLARMCG